MTQLLHTPYSSPSFAAGSQHDEEKRQPKKDEGGEEQQGRPDTPCVAEGKVGTGSPDRVDERDLEPAQKAGPDERLQDHVDEGMPSGRKTHQAPNQRADDPRDDITDEVVP